MSVMPMRKVSLVAREEDRYALMTTLQEAGLIHVSPLPSAELNLVEENNIGNLARDLSMVERAIQNIKKFEASSATIPPRCNNARDSLPVVLNLVDEIARTTKKREELQEKIEKWAPFGEFEQDSNELKKAGLSLKLATLSDLEIVKLKKAGHCVHVVDKRDEISHVAIIHSQSQPVLVETFAPPTLSLAKKRQELMDLQAQYQDLSRELARWYYQLRSFEKLEEEIRLKHARLVELKKSCTNSGLFGVSGFILKENTEQLKKSLLSHIVALRIEDPKKGWGVPVKLQNPKLLQGFETIIRAFSGVNYFERDKTKIVFMLFVIFGSLCLLDGGYGALLFVAGYILSIKKSKSFGQVFMWTGAFSTVLGLLCGQVFGLVFAQDILLNIPPIFTLATDPMACFKFSLLVGFFALLLSNLVATFEKGIATNGLGNILAVCAGLLAVANKTGLFAGLIHNSEILLTNICWLLLGLTILAWVVFPEDVFGKDSRIANILWTLYSGPVSLIQDILSHMRLFGIALSGAILALVVNKISGMMPLVAGAVFAPLGHFFVFMLALLSLYIHTNRLIFLEFGSKCMTGGNNYFTPFSRRTHDEKNY